MQVSAHLLKNIILWQQNFDNPVDLKFQEQMDMVIPTFPNIPEKLTKKILQHGMKPKKSSNPCWCIKGQFSVTTWETDQLFQTNIEKNKAQSSIKWHLSVTTQENEQKIKTSIDQNKDKASITLLHLLPMWFLSHPHLKHIIQNHSSMLNEPGFKKQWRFSWIIPAFHTQKNFQMSNKGQRKWEGIVSTNYKIKARYLVSWMV